MDGCMYVYAVHMCGVLERERGEGGRVGKRKWRMGGNVYLLNLFI